LERGLVLRGRKNRKAQAAATGLAATGSVPEAATLVRSVEREEPGSSVQAISAPPTVEAPVPAKSRKPGKSPKTRSPKPNRSADAKRRPVPKGPARQTRLTRLVGLAFCVGGFAAIGFGWSGAASKDCVPCQMPYLLSGGAVGIGLIAFGVGMMIMAQLRTEGRRLAERLEAWRPSASSAGEAVAAGEGKEPAVGGPDLPPARPMPNGASPAPVTPGVEPEEAPAP
jgi:hypothetical protein